MYYKKVIIESEADLPKEGEQFFCKIKGNDNFYVFNAVTLRAYGISIDWYLLPMEDEDVYQEITSRWEAALSSLLTELDDNNE